MKVMRPVVILLLLLAMAIPGISRVAVAKNQTASDQDSQGITPEEEEEARDLAYQFATRFEESGDIEPLINDLFIDGFAERLRSEQDASLLFPVQLTDEFAEIISIDDYRRLYIASMNSFYAAMRLYAVALGNIEQNHDERSDKEPQQNNRNPTLEDLIPPKVLKLIRSDPVLAASLDKALKEEKARDSSRDDEPSTAAGSETPSGDSSEVSEVREYELEFRNVEQARYYASLMEEGVKLVREHLQALPPDRNPTIAQFFGRECRKSGDDAAECVRNSVCPTLSFLEESGSMGYGPGTRVINADVLLFRLTMVRNGNGRLKILTAGVYID